MVVENSVRNSGIANDLRAVSFVDPNTAVAVGGAGAILRTDDGGKTWFKLQSGTTDGLTAVTFFDAHRGIASGGHFVFPFHYYGITLLTADSGATWTGVQEGAWFRGLSFVSPEIGTGVGYTGGEVSSSIIRRTTDGGLSWREQSGFRFAPLFGVSLVDTNTGTVVGQYGTILRTRDGGVTWTRQTSGTTNGLSGVSFLDSDTGVAVGSYGIIVRTDDGGETWTVENSGLPSLQAVSFVDAGRPSVARRH